MKIYSELAAWYPLFTPREHYRDEAATYLDVFQRALGPGHHTLLELGAGAGHNAYYLAPHFDLTLTDLSPEMLELARSNCPDATLVVGDMRTLRLGRTYDAVFVHDAVAYMLTERDLAAVFETARAHLREGGTLLVVPDYVAETFEPGEDCDGGDGDGRSLRYLEWVWQREGQHDRYVVDYAIMTRMGDDAPTIAHERHEEGLFARATWLRLLDEAGFDIERIAWHEPTVERELEMFLGRAR